MSDKDKIVIHHIIGTKYIFVDFVHCRLAYLKQEKIFKKDNRRRLNRCVFCNMPLGE